MALRQVKQLILGSLHIKVSQEATGGGTMETLVFVNGEKLFQTLSGCKDYLNLEEAQPNNVIAYVMDKLL